MFDTTRAKLLYETGIAARHIPLEDFDGELLDPHRTSTHCPFKGDATYWSVRPDSRTAVWDSTGGPERGGPG